MRQTRRAPLMLTLIVCAGCQSEPSIPEADMQACDTVVVAYDFRGLRQNVRNMYFLDAATRLVDAEDDELYEIGEELLAEMADSASSDSPPSLGAFRLIRSASRRCARLGHTPVE